MPITATRDIVQAIISSPAPAVKANGLRVSAAALKQLDANGDGSLTRDELTLAIDRLDVAHREQLASAAETYLADKSPSLPSKVLLLGSAFATAAFMVMRLSTLSALIFGTASLLGLGATQLLDTRRYRAAVGPFHKALDEAFGA